jgi:6,7-dimethyl-8-ribityllumazine synthase
MHKISIVAARWNAELVNDLVNAAFLIHRNISNSGQNEPDNILE